MATKLRSLRRREWRQNQLKLAENGDFKPTRALLDIDDADIRDGIENNQLKLQRERGTDKTISPPRAVGMGHHIGTAETSQEWTQITKRYDSPCSEYVSAEF